LESGYYGLLHKCYKLPFGTQSLIFDLLPGSIVILDKGNVTLKKKGLNSLLRKVIFLIKDNPLSKEALVREIWGYEYDPQRHATLIYSSINKVRKLLEPHGDWITLSEEGYHIQKNVKVIIKNSLRQKKEIAQKNTAPLLNTLHPQKKMTNKSLLPKNFKDLNFRQLQVIDYLKQNSSINIFELSSKLHISKPTATRDLSKLVELGIVTRIGKGRATRYFR
jgi:DNA-binding transcriptional ArsR family regulator